MSNQIKSVFSFAFWVTLVGVGIVAIYMIFAQPPAKISFPYPLAEPPAKAVTKDLWDALQSGSTFSLNPDYCGDPSHELPDFTSSKKPLPAKAEFPKSRFSNILCKLEEALQMQEKDKQLPVILAAAYSWRAQMRVEPQNTIRDLYEARYHAAQAVANGNKLAAGFQASPTWLLGYITQDQNKERARELREEGHKMMVDDTREFAAFHGYVEGALFSAMLNPEELDPEFKYKLSIESLLDNLEACLWGESFLRHIPLPEGMRVNNFVMNLISRVSILSGRGYCYNNTAAPFNIPGLYITQGDAYLKDGQMKYARIAYENALAAPNAAYWAQADEVHIRLSDMDGTRKKFLQDSKAFSVPQKPTAMVAQATWFCASCHQSENAAQRNAVEKGL